MIVLSNSTDQTLGVGQTLTFDIVKLHTGCGECHRSNTGSVKLRCNGVYEINFSGNVTGTIANSEVDIAVAIGGETLSETIMSYVPATAGYPSNVSTSTAVKNCCGDYDRITIVNVGTTPITVRRDSCLFIKRLS